MKRLKGCFIQLTELLQMVSEFTFGLELFVKITSGVLILEN